MLTTPMTKKVPLKLKNGRPIPIMDTQLADFPGEQWKEIPDFDDYLLSNYGRVKSLKRTVITKNGYEFPVEEKILKLEIRQFKEAIIIKVRLTKTGYKSTYYSLPRLVYNLFVGQLEYSNKSIVVGRKDNDPLNCDAENLMLQNTGTANMTPVNQYNKIGQFVKRHTNVHEAANSLNIPVSQIIEAIAEKYLQGKENFWRRGEPLPGIDISKWQSAKANAGISKFRAVQKLTLDGIPLEIYDSITDAAKALSVKSLAGIHKACADNKLTAFGFRWCYWDSSKQSSEIGNEIKNNGKNIANKYNEPVHQYDIDGKFMRTYSSPTEASKELNVSNGSISNAISSEFKMVKESYWRRGKPETSIDVSGYELHRQRYFNSAEQPVQKITLDGQVLETYVSITAAANALGVRNTLMAKACKSKKGTCRGFRWRFA